MANVKWPFGLADLFALSATGAQAITIANDLTIIDGVSTIATGNRTINLTIPSDLTPGARIIVKSKTTGTETTIFGTGCIAATVTGVAGKTKTQELVFDGTNFIGSSTAVQID
jgi:hypothetical protein